jgi:lysophospholipase L1-like esterase
VVDWKILCNGTVTTGSQAVTVVAGNVVSFGVGAGAYAAAYGIPGELVSSVDQLLGYSRRLNDSERDTLFADVAARVASAYPNDAPLVVCEGDSIMRGLYLEPRVKQATYAALENLWPSYPTLRMAVTALSGDTTQAVINRYVADVRPLYSASRAKNILVCAVGTNDFAAVGAAASATVTKNLLWEYCDLAKADGWLVIPATMLPREGQAPQFETERVAYNNAIRAEWGARGYAGIYDEASISGMRTFDDSTGLNYSDGTHPSEAGAILLSAELQSTLAAVLAS